MKRLPLTVAASLLCATLFFGCRTQQTGTTRVITLRGDTVIRERVVPVVSPADSARIKALMRCDENGRVLLDWYEQECSKNARLKFKLDTLGKLMIAFDVLRDTVYIPVADTTVNRSRYAPAVPAPCSMRCRLSPHASTPLATQATTSTSWAWRTWRLPWATQATR